MISRPSQQRIRGSWIALVSATTTLPACGGAGLSSDAGPPSASDARLDVADSSAPGRGNKHDGGGGDAHDAASGTDGQARADAGSRDPLEQPFASTSIWNMPIGSGAMYVPANLTADPPGGSNSYVQSDDERISLTPTAPATSVYYSSAGWS